MSDDDSPRPSKRFRRSKEVPATHEDMAQHNPMSRRVLRKEAKRARRAAKSRGDGCGDGMDVDDGLEFTFMA
jgi:nuclear GTP-binding protein